MSEPDRIERWYTEIGRVVTTAASLEAAVGTLLYALQTGADDHLYPWTMDQLISACRSEFAKVDITLAQQLEIVMVNLDELNRLRNDVVHGWWRFGRDGADALRGRAMRKQPALTLTKIQFNEMHELRGRLEFTRGVVQRYITTVVEVGT